MTNPNYLLQFRGVDIEDPMSRQSRLNEMRTGQVRNALADLQLAQLQEEQAYAKSPQAMQKKARAERLAANEEQQQYVKDALMSGRVTPQTWNDFGAELEGEFGPGYGGVFAQPYSPDNEKMVLDRLGIGPKAQKELDPVTQMLREAQAANLRSLINSRTGDPGQPHIQLDEGDPLLAITDKNIREREIANRLSANEKELSEFDLEAEKARTRSDAGKRFMTAYKKQAGDITGSMGSKIVPGFLSGWNEEMAAMDRESALLVPSQRVAGSGTTSDFDAMMFEKATLGRKNPLSVNQMISDAYDRDARRQRERASFFRSFSSSKGGNLTAAKKIWNDYVNEQSIFNQDGSLNQNEKTFQQWMDEKRGVSSPAGGDYSRLWK